MAAAIAARHRPPAPRRLADSARWLTRYERRRARRTLRRAVPSAGNDVVGTVALAIDHPLVYSCRSETAARIQSRTRCDPAPLELTRPRPSALGDTAPDPAM